MSLNHFRFECTPISEVAAIVSGPHVRFTVLTSRLIRLEYSPADTFEDRASQAFWYRRQPVPAFQLRQTDTQIEIETDHLVLRYHPNVRGFTPGSLTIHVKATGITWSFADHAWKSGNLHGTTRTLDVTNGHAELEPGLMSRNGWAIVDDSRSLVFDEQGWLTARTLPDNLDLYFFGYGHDYIGCLQDFQKVAGATPLIPRWILGNWWSRFWKYTQTELQALMEDFEAHQTPLSVCIVDMDWHITQTGNQSVGWTGYTWNNQLFPEPSALIAWLHAKGLKTALNLHPADGVFPHETQYQQMAAQMGIDPASHDPVPFDISDPQFADAYFTLLHHPYEADGVDFWWVDWQQGTQSKIKGLDPLWWLNHLHFYDLGRDGHKRPLIFSRWGGLGNHRYPIGFSGDTVVSWESLAFQPYFTATAANVGYGWWSHDIGGHMWGLEEGELYLRWVQFGVFSPILRLHSTNNPYSERRPWGWGAEIEQPACEAMRLRHALLPYLYTMAWRNRQQGIPLITPLYYSHPEVDDAYHCPQGYWFGSELVATPFTAPRLPDLGLSRQRVWLPEGDWFNFFTGERYVGGWHTVYGDLHTIPVFAKAGAIVPLGPKVGWGGVSNPGQLSVHIFAGADNQFTLYEDDGETVEYQQGRYVLTQFEQQWRENMLTFTIAPATCDLTVIPATRTYQLVLHGIAFPEQIALTLNGQSVTPAMQYDALAESLTVTIAQVRPTDALTLQLTAAQPSLLAKRDRRAETVRRMLRTFKLDSRVKVRIDADLPLLLRGELALARYNLSEVQQSTLAQVLNHLDAAMGDVRR
jgi:alpha-glucosidase (family GH31 glycosyl hydrolase)